MLLGDNIAWQSLMMLLIMSAAQKFKVKECCLYVQKLTVSCREDLNYMP